MCMVGCRSLATREASSILKFGSRVTLQERDRAIFQFMQAGGLLAAHFEIGPLPHLDLQSWHAKQFARNFYAGSVAADERNIGAINMMEAH